MSITKLQIIFISLGLLISNDLLASDVDVFGLIITNNRSYTHTRPDLQYADDDGARYHSFFKMVAAYEHLSLLTKFDEPTRRLYPNLATKLKKPTKRILIKEISRIASLVEKANKNGRKTAFYFVFAGHGHVDSGKGFLELEDSRIGSTFLEKEMLDKIKADSVHIILDSCNSFFVVNPRKPGGKRWATPKDMTKGFSKRYPHVGVVLSTNSASEVYEWSEIGSGIFSHEIRSGLSGAADANGDKMVSYDEIEAFVSTANLGIVNEAYIPKVFIRGPFNKGNANLLNLKTAKSRELVLGKKKRRIWIRDERGVRLVDIHKEEGATLNLMLPGDESQSLYIQEQTVNEYGRYVLNQYVTPKDNYFTPLSIDSLEREKTTVSARGHDEVFRMLFANPYGPNAYKTYVTEKPEKEEMVFGISKEHEKRMEHYLGTLAESDKQSRIISGMLSLGFGAAFVTTAVLGGTVASDHDEKGIIAFPIAAGSLLIGHGLFKLFLKSEGEKLYSLFINELKMTKNKDATTLVAKTELHLEKIRKRERRRRIAMAITMYTLGVTSVGFGIGTLAFNDKEESHDSEGHIIFGTMSLALGAVAIGYGITRHFIKTPTERMVELYKKDPDLNVYFAVAPIKNGAAAGLTVQF